MTPYYLGSYYLIRPKPAYFWSQNLRTVYTASNCINESLLGIWSYSWTSGNDDDINSIKQKYSIDDATVHSVRQWADSALNDEQIGWFNVFNHLDTAKEYQQTFFGHLPYTKILGIYFTETDTEDILRNLKPQRENVGPGGLYKRLKEKTPESDSATEMLIGFDLVGMDFTGDFHSFYCNVAPEAFTERYDLAINQYGLFEDSDQWQVVIDDLNNAEKGFEPVPWYVCKTKLAVE